MTADEIKAKSSEYAKALLSLEEAQGRTSALLRQAWLNVHNTSVDGGGTL